MSFNSYGGIFFSLVILIVYNLLSERKRQNIFLLGASFYFYATSSILFSSLLILTIYIGFFAGQLIQSRRESKKNTKLYLWVSIITLLGMLAIFKYYGFFTESFAAALDLIGLPVSQVTLSIVLPIGISFYIFQTIGYIVDVYRKDIDAEEDLVDFALFVSFFPQLVAGPIERSKNLLQQVKNKRQKITRNDATYGVFLIIQGYLKKVVIADNIAPYVDSIFSHNQISSPIIWVGLLLFAIQIYCDFSGYTDIARGYSRLLGFRILLNFDRPYAARSPANFWRRWHISLSNWITEYVYFGLGGNRSKYAARRGGNVVATMTLSGLWHGASANFIAWGAYHGFVILGGRFLGNLIPKPFKKSKIGTSLSIISTFFLMLYGWMYFRITSFEQIMAYNYALVYKWDGWAVAQAYLIQGSLFLILWLVVDIFELFWLKVHEHEVKKSNGIWIYMGIMLAVVLLYQADSPGEFIYFRF